MKEDGVTAEGEVPIPKQIRIRLAPFEGTDEVTVVCALRCNTDAKGVKLLYRMLNIDAIQDNAVNEVFEKIQPQLKGYSFTKGTP